MLFSYWQPKIIPSVVDRTSIAKWVIIKPRWRLLVVEIIGRFEEFTA